MSEYLLAISIGPVQEFIAAARKTRDLWFGSEMLSEVAREVARGLRDAGATLIFPSPDGVDGNAAVANKLLLKTDQDPAALVRSARQAAQARIERFADQALGRCGDLAGRVNEALLRQQLAGFLEFYAAWVPFSAATYATDRKEVERLLAGRKTLRDFHPAAGQAGVPKSSLDPSRESVIDWRGWPKNMRPPAGTRKDEQLDGVSLVKRLAPRTRFASVSRVAVDPLVRRLNATDPAALQRLRQAAERLKDTGAVERFSGLPQFDAFPFDTELWYRDDERAEEKTADAEDFRAGLRDALRQQRLPDPPAYYAVLVADGDRMGEFIGTLGSVAAHQQFSGHLVDFAAAAEQIVADHQGALVYSGGDDVLAFLPLDRALDCAGALRRSFGSHVGGAGETAATLTVGIALVHYQEPLSQVLDWARAAEQAGKHGGRNALALVLHTRSGGQATRVTMSWKDDPVASRWHQWIELVRADALPGGAAYELRSLAMEMEALGADDAANEAVRVEARRILTRKRLPHSQTPMLTQHVDALLAGLQIRQSATLALGDLANELIIARHIAGTIDLAETGGVPLDELPR